MSGQTITLKASDGSFSGYLAKPASGRGPGVIVIQEIFGVNGFVREVADGWAKAGYFALAPDLFWRIERNVDITPNSEAAWKKAFDLFGKFKVDTGVSDIQAAIDALRQTAGSTGKVGAVGYCLGGLLAYLTAARTSADAAVGFYGVSIDQRLDEAKTIKKPLMLHIAAKDGFVPKEAQDKITAGLSTHPQITLHVYANEDHAFARTGGEHYSKAAADLANGRTSEFFKRHLG